MLNLPKIRYDGKCKINIVIIIFLNIVGIRVESYSFIEWFGFTKNLSVRCYLSDIIDILNDKCIDFAWYLTVCFGVPRKLHVTVYRSKHKTVYQRYRPSLIMLHAAPKKTFVRGHTEKIVMRRVLLLYIVCAFLCALDRTKSIFSIWWFYFTLIVFDNPT